VSDAAFLTKAAEGVVVRLRVQPRASRDRLEGLWTGSDGAQALRVAITAPPEGGKANAAVIKLLAKAWRLPKTSFSITAGAAARTKTVRIAGDPSELAELLLRWKRETET
jgi:uncharacterized protein